MYKKKDLKNWAFRKIIKIEKYAFRPMKKQKLSKKYNKKIASLKLIEKKEAIDKSKQIKYFIDMYQLIYTGKDYSALYSVLGGE